MAEDGETAQEEWGGGGSRRKKKRERDVDKTIYSSIRRLINSSTEGVVVPTGVNESKAVYERGEWVDPKGSDCGLSSIRGRMMRCLTSDV